MKPTEIYSLDIFEEQWQIQRVGWEQEVADAEFPV